MTHYITLGGKERPIKFGWKANKLISKKLKLKLTDFNKLMDSFDNIEIMTYYGLICGAEKTGQPVDFKLKDMTDWFDEESGMGVLHKILEIYAESQEEEEKSNNANNKGK